MTGRKTRGDGVLERRKRYSEYKSAVLRAVYSGGGISRTRLGQLLGIRLATITEIAKELIEQGFLREKGKVRNQSGVGKKETLLAIRPEGRFFAGCELSPGRISLRFLDLGGRALPGKIIPFGEKDKFSILDRIVAEFEKEIKRLKISREKLHGLGFVDPGIIDVEAGRSVSSTIMPLWRDVPTGNYLSKKLGLSVFMIGTSQARALAECLFGAGRGIPNFIFIEYSKGVACGIVSEGNLVRGKNELAGEFGHFRFAGRKELCGCGRQGCLEAVAGPSALEGKAREILARHPGGVLHEICGGNAEMATLEALAKAAAGGDRASLEILDEASEHIAVAISNLIHILDPAKVIFDRSFLACGREFVDDVINRVRKEVIIPSEIIFEVSGIDSMEGAVGGAGLALHEFLELGFTRA